MIKRILNWSFSLKMSLVGFVLLCTLIIPCIFLFNLASDKIVASEQEAKGLSAANAVIELLISVQLHRGISSIYLSSGELGDRRQSLAVSVNDKLAILNAEIVKSEWNNNIVSANYSKLQKDWIKIENDVNSSSIGSQESFLKHSALINYLLNKVMNSILDSSGLSYDPSPETYHLIISSYQNAPRLLEALAKLRGASSNLIAAKSVGASAEDREKIKISVLQASSSFFGPYDDFIYNLEVAAGLGSLSSSKELTSEAKNLAEKVNFYNSFISEKVLVNEDIVDVTASQAFDTGTQLISAFVSNVNSISKVLQDVFFERISEERSELRFMLTIIFVLMLLVIAISVFLILDLKSRLAFAVTTAVSISKGNFEFEKRTQRLDEVGLLLTELQNMAEDLKRAALQAIELKRRSEDDAVNAKKEAQKVKEDLLRAVENTRIRQALDVTSTNVMVADVNRTIVYMNEAMKASLTKAEAAMRSYLPDFFVDKVIGSSIDLFHKQPKHQANILQNLNSVYVANITVANMYFRLTVNPIFDDKKQRIGTVVEWLDRTAEVNAEKEVSSVVSAALEGKFDLTVTEADKDGFMAFLARGLNSLTHTTSASLNDINRVLGAIAQGDLTERVTEDYQGSFGALKDGCNETAENLSQMLSEIREAVETINTASSEISQGNTNLSSRTEQQASSLEETASSMEELTSTVRQNADNARQANTLAAKASDVAVEGGSLIEQVVKTMASINESAQKISDIIGVIDGIAFQTNILALNAAVEAARAGEQGRGFAVVASEVRTLAQRSANAAKDIKALISDSVNKINNGNELVGKSGNTMKEIVTSIKRVNDIMAEIAAASSEQSAGLDEVGKAVTQMDEMTQQNAALVEEAAAAAESLLSQSEQLAANVARFTLDDEPVQPVRKALAAPKRQVRAAASPAVKAQAKPATKLLKPTKSDEDEWESF
ncbi:methyl-accepting chemotaxis protein [Rheinheimera baltica]|uniref:methyl-accepting chemotaxis protein n=1 Tax=Rheinheimera baltica TaxID=67576 RepID=UPI00274002C4|nr:methyl-accepting chemotaxis protein [Rheinheimera baltica]